MFDITWGPIAKERVESLLWLTCLVNYESSDRPIHPTNNPGQCGKPYSIDTRSIKPPNRAIFEDKLPNSLFRHETRQAKLQHELFS